VEAAAVEEADKVAALQVEAVEATAAATAAVAVAGLQVEAVGRAATARPG
jgi:hypothetical protein